MSVNSRTRRSPILQLSGIAWSFCLQISGLKGCSGSSCQALFGLSVCQFRASRDSGASAVEYCRVFLYLHFGPRGTHGLQLSSTIWSFCLSLSGLEGLWGFSCRVLSGLPVCQFLASRDFRAPAVGYYLILSSDNFGPRGTLKLQLSGILLSFCPSIPGLEGLSGSSCRILSDLFV